MHEKVRYLAQVTIDTYGKILHVGFSLISIASYRYAVLIAIALVMFTCLDARISIIYPLQKKISSCNEVLSFISSNFHLLICLFNRSIRYVRPIAIYIHTIASYSVAIYSYITIHKINWSKLHDHLSFKSGCTYNIDIINSFSAFELPYHCTHANVSYTFT